MKCGRCGNPINDDESTYRHGGQDLCEDCYLDAASAPRACDPWAVHTAKSAIDLGGGAGPVLSDVQSGILAALGEENGVEPDVLAGRVGLKLSELERELATLRHMEKIRGALRDGKKIVLLW